MAHVTFTNEQLNYLKFAAIVTEEFSSALRHCFVDMWDSLYVSSPGALPRTWDDSLTVRRTLWSKERKPLLPPSIKKWDVTELCTNTIYATTFAVPDATGKLRTLSQMYIIPLTRGLGGVGRDDFLPDPRTTGRSPEEVRVLAIDQLRRLRNELTHSPNTKEIDTVRFNELVQLAKDSIDALGVPTDAIDMVRAQSDDDFPTERTRRLNLMITELSKEVEVLKDVVIRVKVTESKMNRVINFGWFIAFIVVCVCLYLIYCYINNNPKLQLNWTTMKKEQISDSNRNGCPKDSSILLPGELQLIPLKDYLETRRENFTGRRWLYKQIERVLLAQHSPTIALVIGDLGFGKSAAVANLICNASSSHVIHNNLIGYYVCNFRNEATWNPGIFAQNLANTIAKNMPEYHRLIKNSIYIKQCLQFPSNCFLEGVLNPLMSLSKPDSTKKFIAFDAMDECYDSDKGKIPILQMILDHLEKFPKWLKIIMTSRPQSQYDTLNPNQVRQISVGNYMGKAKKDAEEFLMEKLRSASISNLTHVENVTGVTVKQIAELSNGNFLFVAEMLDDLLNNLRNEQTPDLHLYSFPRGLSDLFLRNFQRHFSQTKDFNLCRQIFEIMLAYRHPYKGIDVSFIYKVLEVTNPQSFGYYTDVVDALRQLSHYVRYKDVHIPLEFNHRYVVEWLTSLNRTKENPMFYVSIEDGHNMIADFLIKKATYRNGDLSSELVVEISFHIGAGGMDQKRMESFRKLPLQLDCHTTNPVCKSHRKLLIFAASHYRSDFLKLLLLHNISDIDAPPITSLRPTEISDIHFVRKSLACFAARLGRVKNLNLLIKKGADVNQTCFSGVPLESSSSSLLHVATFSGNEETVEFLISSKADIYAIDNNGFDVLSTALLSPYINIFRRLLQAGAKLTPSHLCMAAAKPDLSRYFTRYFNNKSSLYMTYVPPGLECFRVAQTIPYLYPRKIESARLSFIRRKAYTFYSPFTFRKERLFLDLLFALSPIGFHCLSDFDFSFQLLLGAGKYLRWNIFIEFIKEVGILNVFGVCSDAHKPYPTPGRKCAFFLFAKRKPSAFPVPQFSTIFCNILMVVMSPVSTHPNFGQEKSQFCKYSLDAGDNTYKCYLPQFSQNSEILAYFNEVSRMLELKKFICL